MRSVVFSWCTLQPTQYGHPTETIFNFSSAHSEIMLHESLILRDKQCSWPLGQRTSPQFTTSSSCKTILCCVLYNSLHFPGVSWGYIGTPCQLSHKRFCILSQCSFYFAIATTSLCNQGERGRGEQGSCFSAALSTNPGFGNRMKRT